MGKRLNWNRDRHRGKSLETPDRRPTRLERKADDILSGPERRFGFRVGLRSDQLHQPGKWEKPPPKPEPPVTRRFVKGKDYVIILGDGVPCPRCRQPTQIREHSHVGPKELARPFYYRRWFFCLNQNCKVSTYMVDAFRVYREGAPPPVAAKPEPPPTFAGLEHPGITAEPVAKPDRVIYDYPPWEDGPSGG